MIDLHIHTVYSDGSLNVNDVINFSKCYSRFSVTDHNSVGMHLSILNNSDEENNQDYLKKAIVGVELTIDGYPDLLAYYPSITFNLDKLVEIEKKLCQIRKDEESAVIVAYRSLGYENWETERKTAFPSKTMVSEARTMELASIIFQKRTGITKNGFFEYDDLLQARRVRRMVRNKVDIPRINPYDFCCETQGNLVLAHPIKTAIRFASNRDNYESVLESLYSVLAIFYENGGRIIEWEYLDCEFTHIFDRYPVLCDHCYDFRYCVKQIIDKYDFYCVWGSDTHEKQSQGYYSWSNQPFLGIQEYLPEWVVSFDNALYF